MRHTFILLLIALALPIRLLGTPLTSAPSCRDLHAFYIGDTQTERELRIVASHSEVKALTDHFKANSHLTELLISYLHFLFQHNLYATIERHSDIHLLGGDAPYIKFINLHIQTSLDNSAIDQVVREAHTLATQQLASLIFDNNPKISTLIQSVTGTHSALAQEDRYIFIEGRNYIRPISSNQSDVMFATLKRLFGSSDAFRHYMSRGYGVGISSTDVDSHHAARIATDHDDDNQIVYFDMHVLKERLEKAEAMAAKLNWLFSNKSDSDLLRVFILIRGNADREDSAEWDASYRRLLATKFPNNATPSESALINLHRQILDYIGENNLLDYLPLEEDDYSHQQHRLFENVKNPSGVLFVDIRRAGARNMLAAHKLTPRLLSLVREIETKLEELTKRDIAGLKSEALEQEIDGLFHKELLTMRREIFIETAHYIRDIQNRIKSLLKEVSGKKGQYATWSAGDDTFIAVSGVNPHTIAQKILAEETLGQSVRVGFMSLSGVESMTVEAARETVGKLAEPLKQAERLGLEATAEFTLHQGEDAVIFHGPKTVSIDVSVTHSTESRWPEDDTARLQRALSGWRVR